MSVSDDPKSLASVQPKVPRARDASSYKPRTTSIKIHNEKLEWRAEAKVPTVQDTKDYKPRESDVVIYNKPQKYDQVTAIIPTAQEATKYRAGGGTKKITTKKLDWRAEAKIPTAAEAAQYKPHGGDVKICKKP